MVVNWGEQHRVRQQLTDTLTVLLKNCLNYSSKFSVEGLLGITLDDSDILLVNINETVGGGVPFNVSSSPRHTATVGRSPLALGQRFAVTSPRRGRAKPVVSSRGRGAFGAAKKRTLFTTPVKSSRPQPTTVSSPQEQPPLVTTLAGDTDLSEGPPPKLKKEVESTQDDVIEIGDDDDAPTETREIEEVKQEVPEQEPSSANDDQQEEQHQDASSSNNKFALDSDTSKSLTDFLDNLMTQHDVGPRSSGSGTSTPARPGADAVHVTPKTEPDGMPWERQQPPLSAVGYQSPTDGAPSHNSPRHQSQVKKTTFCFVPKLHLASLDCNFELQVKYEGDTKSLFRRVQRNQRSFVSVSIFLCS